VVIFFIGHSLGFLPISIKAGKARIVKAVFATA